MNSCCPAAAIMRRLTGINYMEQIQRKFNHTVHDTLSFQKMKFDLVITCMALCSKPVFLQKMTRAMSSRTSRPMNGELLAVLAPILLEMVGIGEFLNMAATANFHLCEWCKAKARQMRSDVLSGISAIMKHGLILPPFVLPVRPTLAFDPMLLRSPLRRYQRLWQIEGPSERLRGGCPIEMLRSENRLRHWVQWVNLNVYGMSADLLVQAAIDFLAQDCRKVRFAFWEAASSAALPWPLSRLHPRMPRKDGLKVDYAILYFEYKTLGVAMCFWHTSPLGPVLATPPSCASSSDIANSGNYLSEDDEMSEAEP